MKKISTVLLIIIVMLFVSACSPYPSDDATSEVVDVDLIQNAKVKDAYFSGLHDGYYECIDSFPDILIDGAYHDGKKKVTITLTHASGKERDAHICVYIQDSTENWEAEPRIDLKGILYSDGFDEWEFGYGWTMYRSREIFRFPDENPALTGGISGYVTVAYPEISISDIWRSDAVKNGKAFSHTIQNGDMVRLNASDIGQRSALAVSSDFVYTAE